MKAKHIQGIAIIIVALVMSMPFCLAQEMALTYDANGNLVTGDGQFRTYNSLNQLWKVYNGSNSSGYLMNEYTYDPVEERVLIKKTYNSSGTLTETVLYVDQSFVQVQNLSGIYNFTNIYQDGQLVSQVLIGVKTFYLDDNKGDVAVATNSQGQVIETTFYDPFGQVLQGGTSSRYNYEGKEQTSSTLSNGLVGYWSLDANNLTTGGYTFYNGQAVGAVQSPNGKFGSSEYFDGVSDYVNISSSVITSSTFTISFWSYTPSANNNTGYVFCDSNNVGNLFFRRYDSGTTWNGQIYNVNLGSTTNPVPRDQWVYTAVVLNGSNAYVYVNGVLQNMTGSTTGITFTGLSSNLWLGNRPALDRSFEGNLDNFRIYNRAMSQAEIQNIYTTELAHPIYSNGLVTSYEFEQGANDSHNVIAGRIDGAYNMNGNGNYVIVNDNPVLDMNTSLSVSAWFRINATLPYRQALVSKYYYEYELDVYPGGKLHTYTSNGTTGYDEGINAFINPTFNETDWIPGKWYNVIWTLNGTQEVIYVNGVQIGAANKADSGTKSGTHDLYIGRRWGDSLDFNGTIDEVGIWNRAINAIEAKSVYENGIISHFNAPTDFNARMYMPSLGFFTQPDTVIQNVYDPQSLNRYMYERGNPYRNIDPSGHEFVVDNVAELAIFGLAFALVYFGVVSISVIPPQGQELYNGLKQYYQARANANTAIEANNIKNKFFALLRNPTPSNYNAFSKALGGFLIDFGIGEYMQTEGGSDSKIAYDNTPIETGDQSISIGGIVTDLGFQADSAISSFMKLNSGNSDQQTKNKGGGSQRNSFDNPLTAGQNNADSEYSSSLTDNDFCVNHSAYWCHY